MSSTNLDSAVALDFRPGYVPGPTGADRIVQHGKAAGAVPSRVVSGSTIRRRARTSGKGRSSGRIGSDLTQREIEVLRLVASGATDQSIADELYIARRTVTTHVAAILAKLDAGNRTAATTVALRNNLV